MRRERATPGRPVSADEQGGEGRRGFAFIPAEKTTYGVRLLCRVLGLSNTGILDWEALGGGPTEHEVAVAYATNELHSAWAEHRGPYGAPRLTADTRDGGRDWAPSGSPR